MPLQTSARFWKPSAITTFTLLFVIPTGVRRTDGTSVVPLFVTPFVGAFVPLMSETARSTAALASCFLTRYANLAV